MSKKCRFLVIYSSTSELPGDGKTRKAQVFFYLLNNRVHFVACELKVTNPLKRRNREGANVMFTEDTSSITLHTKVFLRFIRSCGTSCRSNDLFLATRHPLCQRVVQYRHRPLNLSKPKQRSCFQGRQSVLNVTASGCSRIVLVLFYTDSS